MNPKLHLIMSLTLLRPDLTTDIEVWSMRNFTLVALLVVIFVITCHLQDYTALYIMSESEVTGDKMIINFTTKFDCRHSLVKSITT